jgi:hypothetical protein
MKTFTNIAAQGDFYIIRKEVYEKFYSKFPDRNTLVEVTPVNGKIVVAHSETGHNHVMTMDRATAYKNKDANEVDLYELFLLVKEPSEITHLRDYETHETLLVPEGEFIIKRQRESTPEGFKKAVD